jgi:hypothetical protein
LHSSQFEEKFEEINGVDVAPKIPSSLEVNMHLSTTVVPEDKGKEIEVQAQDGEGPSSDPTNTHDFVSGIMKIVPSDVAVSITSVRDSCFMYLQRIILRIHALQIDKKECKGFRVPKSV